MSVSLQDFAVGVVTRTGQYQVINSGPLPEAVAASIAIPFIFGAVDIPGTTGHRCTDDAVAMTAA